MQQLRYDYEVVGLGSRKLERKYGYARSSIQNIIRAGKWMRAGAEADVPHGSPPSRQEREAQIEVLAKGLADPLHRGHEIPPNPSLVPSQVDLLNAGTVDSATAAPPPPTDEKPAVALDPPPEATDESKSEASSRVVPKSGKVIKFPGVAFPMPAEANPRARVLPEPTMEERARLRTTLATLRAMMTVEQVAVLEHHEAVLRRYSHLLEVYLEPARFVVAAEGMSAEELTDKIVETQSLALRQLLPTERDTLAGAIKTLTEAIQRTILLKRAVAGLQLPTGRGGASAPLAGPEIDGEASPVKSSANLANLPTSQLREVTRAMELLERHQHAHADAPKPPPPDPIDDIFDEPIADSDRVSEPPEPEVPR